MSYVVSFVSGPGHYNEARHGLMDVARDEPCLTRITGPHLDPSTDREMIKTGWQKLLHAAHSVYITVYP